MSTQSYSRTIHVQPPLQPFLDEAVSRLQYLFPENEIKAGLGSVSFTASSEAEAKKLSTEIRYTLYRAKFRAEGERERAVMFRAVFGS